MTSTPALVAMLREPCTEPEFFADYRVAGTTRFSKHRRCCPYDGKAQRTNQKKRQHTPSPLNIRSMDEQQLPALRTIGGPARNKVANPY